MVRKLFWAAAHAAATPNQQHNHSIQNWTYNLNMVPVCKNRMCRMCGGSLIALMAFLQSVPLRDCFPFRRTECGPLMCVSPSMCAISMLRFTLCREGCMLNRLATKAKLSLLFPLVTSWGETNCLQSSRAACCSMSSARWVRLCSFRHTGTKKKVGKRVRGGKKAANSANCKTRASHSGRSCRSGCSSC